MQVANDFVAIFNAFWYRDFPLSKDHKRFGTRAEWTIHIGICVRSCADLMGLFPYFESGGRTDAILKDNRQNEIAHIEWEWWEASSPKVNEIGKLFKQRTTAEFSVFISYSDQDALEKNLDSVQKQWGRSPEPLLIFLVTFEKDGRKRMFKNLETYLVENGKRVRIRVQPALPWQAMGTRWESNSME